MRINIFELNDKREDWRKVEDAMYQIWIGNQTGAILPMCCDFEFQKAFNRIKKRHSISDFKQALNIV